MFTPPSPQHIALPWGSVSLAVAPGQRPRHLTCWPDGLGIVGAEQAAALSSTGWQGGG